MRARTARGDRHSDRTRGKRRIAEPNVRSPRPRPKLPRRLCHGASDVSVVTTHQRKYAATIATSHRPERSRAPARTLAPLEEPCEPGQRDQDGKRPRLRIVIRSRRGPENGHRHAEQHGAEAHEDVRARRERSGRIERGGARDPSAHARLASPKAPLCRRGAGRAQDAPSPRRTTGIVWSRMRRSRPNDQRST